MVQVFSYYAFYSLKHLHLWWLSTEDNANLLSSPVQVNKLFNPPSSSHPWPEFGVFLLLFRWSRLGKGFNNDDDSIELRLSILLFRFIFCTSAREMLILQINWRFVYVPTSYKRFCVSVRSFYPRPLLVNVQESINQWIDEKPLILHVALFFTPV